MLDSTHIFRENLFLLEKKQGEQVIEWRLSDLEFLPLLWEQSLLLMYIIISCMSEKETNSQKQEFLPNSLCLASKM